MTNCRFSLLLSLFLVTLPSYSAEAHVHGAATLQIAVDGSSLLLNLSSPLDSLLGFEHLPRTDKQKTAVREMESKLRKADRLFFPTPAAGCKLKSVNLESLVLENQQKDAHHHEVDSHEKGETHADIDGEFVFQCAKPAELKGLDVKLFAAFPGLHQLKAEVATQRGQTAATLTPGIHQIKW